MGSLNFGSLRPRGRVKEIQADHEKSVKKKEKQDEIEKIGVKLAKSLKLSRSPPPAPFMIKRRRRFENAECIPPRRLWDEIDKEAEECGMKEISGSEAASTRTPSPASDKARSMGNGETGVRVSPTRPKCD